MQIVQLLDQPVPELLGLPLEVEGVGHVGAGQSHGRRADRNERACEGGALDDPSLCCVRGGEARHVLAVGVGGQTLRLRHDDSVVVERKVLGSRYTVAGERGRPQLLEARIVRVVAVAEPPHRGFDLGLEGRARGQRMERGAERRQDPREDDPQRDPQAQQGGKRAARRPGRCGHEQRDRGAA